MTNIIKIENVWKTYDLGKIKLNVLKNVSLEIDQGDFAIILGPSGSGKSTLLNLVSCLDVPTKGSIFFKGKNISEFSEDELAEIRGKDIGFVFQRFNLLPHLTALENVVLPTIFQGKEEKESIGLARSILESVGLKERLNHRPTELSGGENQRVAIARALINNPEIVVADEPTGNKIMDILVELNKKEGKTVIVVTHNNDQVKYGNRIIRIKDGEIVK